MKNKYYIVVVNDQEEAFNYEKKSEDLLKKDQQINSQKLGISAMSIIKGNSVVISAR